MGESAGKQLSFGARAENPGSWQAKVKTAHTRRII
jgi:hypothetical protein